MEGNNPFPILMLKLCALLKRNKSIKKSLPEIIKMGAVVVGEIIEVGGARIIRETRNKMIGNKEILMINQLPNVIDVVKLVILLLTIKSLGRKSMKGENN